ncbi:hypothetical protein ENUP19_0298G0052 [Entamoeba nuttalli]|uniref:Phosphatidylinositol 3-kinase n=2 Tax=Entamoeba nuttalli TaxID=412467 RepID=A0ABQ0DV34_9EUKA
MRSRLTRTTFSVPKITGTTSLLMKNIPVIRVIVENEGKTFTPINTPQQIINFYYDPKKTTEKYYFCLNHQPYYFDRCSEPFFESKFCIYCSSYGYWPTFTLVKVEQCSNYKPINIFLNFLESNKITFDCIGNEFLLVLKANTDECRDFRATLARILQEKIVLFENDVIDKFGGDVQSQQDAKKIYEENEYVYVESEPPIPTSCIELKINGRYGVDMSMKTIVQKPTDTIAKVINNLFTKLYTMKPKIFDKNSKPSDFVLKVRGSNDNNDKIEYILSDFDYIRKCVRLNQNIDVVLFNRKNMYQYMFDKEKMLFVKQFNTFVGNDYWNKLQKNTNDLSQRVAQIQFSIQIISIENIKYLKTIKKEDKKETISITSFRAYFVLSLHYGIRCLEKEKFTNVFQVSEGKLILKEPFNVSFETLLSSLPKETKMTISLYMTELPVGISINEINKKDICLATINCKLVDHHKYFMKGLFKVGMWERTEPNPIMMCCENTSPETCKLHYCVIEFDKPIKMDTFIGTEEEMNVPINTSQKLEVSDTKIFKEAVEADPLTVLSQENCRLLWKYRYLVEKTKPGSLARLVSAVDFTQQSEVLELHRLLNKWPLLEPAHALELLDFRFPDEQVRLFALKCLDAMKDYELVNFLPQLVQALKFELHHQSNLAYFLLRRALRNKNIIGHQFFWFLKAEMHDNRVTERYGVLLEAFLNGCEDYRTELYNEVTFQNQLVVIANKVKQLETKEEQKQLLKDSLAKLKYPEEMSLPLDSRFRIKKPIPNTGNVFSSKKKPLMLVLENVDPLGDNIMVIQKVGDDLRQDVLTLQMLQLMNNIWKSAGLDLRMLPYHCTATGNEIGMLELVQDSETYGKIIADEGGQGTLRVCKEDLLTKWLKKQCSRKESKVTFEQAVENFTYSCAGYCVATYILGVGDRHSDNVMIRRDGRFFHIDFGHFLGHFKSKFGVKRERTPFKFTQHFAHVMGGKGSTQFAIFEDLCLRAFACIRKQGSLFIYLFRLMLATGIPELQHEKDIEYMRDTFMFDKKDDEAKEAFRQLIYECLEAKSQTLNDMIHDFVHYK